MTRSQKDLVVLVADKDMEEGLRALLCRHSALGVRPMDLDVYVHPRRDPGCLRDAQDFLRTWIRRYAHALVVFDREGCGDIGSREKLAEQVRLRLADNGWNDRSAVIVLDPELEIWVWNSSPHVGRILGWEGTSESMREWLEQNGHWPEGAQKPTHPKEAMQAVLRRTSKARSASIYRQLAEIVSLKGHQEPAFQQLCDVLRCWFPCVPEAQSSPEI